MRHSERSETKWSAVEESREIPFEVVSRDPSTSLGMTI